MQITDLPLSIPDSLSRVKPWLEGSLATPLACRRVGEIGAMIGSAVAAGVEVRLGQAAAPVDFGVQILAARHRLALHEFLSRPAVVQARQLDERWARLGHFLQAACDSATTRSTLQKLFLEFDLHEPSSGLPLPGLFLAFQPGLPAAWEQAIHRLRGQPLSAAVTAQLRHAESTLEGRGHIAFYGFMLSRDIEAGRLLISPAAAPALRDWLRDIRWPGDLAALEAEAKNLQHLAHRIHYHFDFGSQPWPVVGLEIFFDPHPPRNRENIRAVLDAWVHRGLCLPATASALHRWPGVIRTGQSSSGGGQVIHTRAVNHLKLTLRPGAPPEAKAYLTFATHSLTP